MGLRRWALVLGLLGCCFAGPLFGLGLGQINLKSALNQPLNAEITLLQLRGLTADEILVSLASPEEFDRVGVERDFFLQNFEFEIILNSPAGNIVRITTDEPVQEPFLNFLVKVEWPTGQALREYTVLLDLPVFDDDPVQAAAPPQPAVPAPQPTPTPRPAPTPEPVPAQPPAPSSPVAVVQPRPSQPEETTPTPRPTPPTPTPEPTRPQVDIYNVRRNDTLWEIALRVRPDRQLSVQQTMLAIQRLNPEAFIDGNINLLKSGQILRIPDADEINGFTRRQAVAEVAQQNIDWSGDPNGQPRGAEVDAGTTRVSSTSNNSEPEGRLTLAAGTDSIATDRSGSGENPQAVALRGELLRAEERLDSARRENNELNSRVDELEDQIDTMEQLLEVSSRELEQLQLAAVAANQVTPEPEPVVEPEESAPEVATPEPEPVDTQPEITPEPTPEPVPTPTPVVAEEGDSVIDLLLDNLVYVLAGAGVLVLGAGLLVYRRRMQAEMAEFDALDDDYYQEDTDLGDDDFGSLDEELEDAGMDLADDDLENYDEELDLDEPASVTASQTEDPASEADIYISMAKFDQAEELLKTALIDDPNNLPVRLKLLELYSKTRNLDKFDHEYSQVLALGDAGASGRAAQLRSAIPNAGQYQEPDGGFFGDDGGALGLDDTDPQGFRLPADIDITDEAESDFGVGVADDSDDDSLDFDLGGLEDLADDESDDDHSVTGLAADLDDLSLGDDLELDEDGDAIDGGELSLDLDFGDTDDATAEIAAADEGESFAFDLDLDGDDDELDLTETAIGTTGVGDFTEPTDNISLQIDDLDLDSGTLDLGSEEVTSSRETAHSNRNNEATEDISGQIDDMQIAADELNDLDAELGLVSGNDTEDFELELDGDFAAAEPEPDISIANVEDTVTVKLDQVGGRSAPSTDLEEDDLLADLTFSGTEVVADVPEIERTGTQAAVDDMDDFGDDLDMDMGDMDLAALDMEMDALVDGSDDELLDAANTDDEVATADKAKPDAVGLAETALRPALDDLDDNDTLDLSESLETVVRDAVPDDEELDPAYDDADLDFLADSDEVATKLDLARAYIDMGDMDGAKDILEEVGSEGNEQQKQEAQALLGKM